MLVFWIDFEKLHKFSDNKHMYFVSAGFCQKWSAIREHSTTTKCYPILTTPSFGSHLHPIPTGWWRIMPTIYWWPNQVLNATGVTANCIPFIHMTKFGLPTSSCPRSFWMPLKTIFFQIGAMPTPTKSRNSTILDQGVLASTQWSHPSRFCYWRLSFGDNGYPPIKSPTQNQKYVPHSDFHFLST